ncbi:MAG: hypothetical protein P1U63_12720 [Coxiellaceae bacterium]|nr:hypothetical protein [Coxiellaceae bacterium]
MKLSFISSVFCAVALTAVSSVQAMDVHTHHHVRATDGDWSGMLSFTSPHEAGFFTDKDDNKLPTQPVFSLSSQVPYYFGFGFSIPGTDFDVSYVVTVVKSKHNGLASPHFASPTCQFNVSASSPGHPDVRVSTYNGAKCQYLDNGQGGDFQVA